METLLNITKSNLSLSEVKELLDFNSKNFKLYTPFEVKTFMESDFYCEPYRIYKKDDYSSSDEVFPKVKDASLYEDYSEELNNFFDNYVSATNEKHNKKSVGHFVKIHSYNHQPFFIEAKYLLYDDDFNKSELINENFEIKQNFIIE